MADREREFEAAKKERDAQVVLIADARAEIRQLERTVAEKSAEVERQKALADAYQREAMRLQSIIEVSANTLLQGVQQEPESGAVSEA